MAKAVTSPKTGAELRRKVLDEYHLESAASLVLVDTAAAALDQALAAEKVIERQGLTVKTTRGVVAHPAVGIAQAARHRMIRALRALNLEV